MSAWLWWAAGLVVLFVVGRVVWARVSGADVEVNVNVSVGEEHARFARKASGRRERVRVASGKDAEKDRKRSQRRGFPIIAFTGSNGGGKSLAAVYDTLPSLRMGRTVLSTVRLLDFENPRECEGSPLDDADMWYLLDAAGRAKACDDPANHSGPLGVHNAAHPAYVPLRDFAQIIDARECDIIMDEVTGVASSRESHAMPMQVANKLVQLRRADVVLRWTTPNWARADKIIREVTQAVVQCSGYLSQQAPATESGERLWRDKRLFMWKTYDAANFDEFTEGKKEKIGAWSSQFFWRPGKAVGDAYDTRDAVLALGWANESGYCMSCGGHRARPKCKCVRDEATEPANVNPGSVNLGSVNPRRPQSGSREVAETRASEASTSETPHDVPTEVAGGAHVPGSHVPGSQAPGRHARTDCLAH